MFEATIKRTFPTAVAYAQMHGPYSQIPEGYGHLYQWVAEHGIAPAGPPSAVYLTMPGQVSESESAWELWAPVAPPQPDLAPDESGIGLKTIEPQTVASTMYQGPYEDCSPTYEALFKWIAENGYVPDGPPSETYFSDPAEVPPEEYLTEIHVPVRHE
jgi:effector-binding domain-containing protein